MTTEPERPGGDARSEAMDPRRDPLLWERTVRGIVHAAGPELARRRRAFLDEGILLLDRWARPLLAAAASLMLLAGGGLLWGGGPEAPTQADRPGIEDVLYPPVVARWIGEGVEPTVEDIAFSPLDW